MDLLNGTALWQQLGHVVSLMVMLSCHKWSTLVAWKEAPWEKSVRLLHLRALHCQALPKSVLKGNHAQRLQLWIVVLPCPVCERNLSRPM